jgi:uncharacterized membrane protein
VIATLLAAGIVTALAGTKFDSIALWGVSIGLLFWSGVLYSI